MANSNYKFPILDSSGNATNQIVDMSDVFVSKDMFLDASLSICGLGSAGELGNNTILSYSSPIQVGALTDWKQVSTGYGCTAAIKDNNELWTWGAGYAGMLGNNAELNYSSPIQVGALTNWKQVSAGYYCISAIKTDGTLWSCGYGTSGQLGNDTVLNYSSPIQIGTLTNWKQVSRSGAYVADNGAAIKTDGTLWTWGSGFYGQLGNTRTLDYSSPIQVGTLTDWKQVACGYHRLFAIKVNGTIWACGYNQSYGALGNNTLINYSSPIQIGTLSDWKQISSGRFHVAAIKQNGTLWTWGAGAQGQLANNTHINYSSPIQVGSLTNWKQVSCGQYTTAAIKTDGTLWTWGNSSTGQLGNNTFQISYNSPVQIGTLTNWKQVSASDQNMAVIQSPESF